MAPALPEITGEFRLAGTTSSTTYAKGSFSISYSGGDYQGGHEAGGPNPTVKFMASYSNTIYGAADTVQPPSLALVPQIKF